MNRKTLLITIFIVIIGSQFIRIDKTKPTTPIANDFLISSRPSENINLILKTSCYDCHSYETNYPWYSNIAPVSWILKNHINEGLEHLNFSEWESYTISSQKHLLNEIIQEIENEEMPLKSYTLLHSEAQINKNDLELLKVWLSSQIKELP